MRIIKQRATLEGINGSEVMRKLERIGRVCWRSEKKIQAGSADKFVRTLIRRGHESVLEHVNVTAFLTVDRAIVQEITRHRIGSYSHESTRYVKYDDIEVILDNGDQDPQVRAMFESAMFSSEFVYKRLIERKIKPEVARDVLPLGLASQLVVTYNLRQWRHFFKLRYLGETGIPHPKIKELAGELLEQFMESLPVIFGDLKETK